MPLYEIVKADGSREKVEADQWMPSGDGSLIVASVYGAVTYAPGASGRGGGVKIPTFDEMDDLFWAVLVCCFCLMTIAMTAYLIIHLFLEVAR